MFDERKAYDKRGEGNHQKSTLILTLRHKNRVRGGGTKKKKGDAG